MNNNPLDIFVKYSIRKIARRDARGGYGYNLLKWVSLSKIDREDISLFPVSNFMEHLVKKYLFECAKAEYVSKNDKSSIVFTIFTKIQISFQQLLSLEEEKRISNINSEKEIREIEKRSSLILSEIKTYEDFLQSASIEGKVTPDMKVNNISELNAKMDMLKEQARVLNEINNNILKNKMKVEQEKQFKIQEKEENIILLITEFSNLSYTLFSRFNEIGKKYNIQLNFYWDCVCRKKKIFAQGKSFKDICIICDIQYIENKEQLFLEERSYIDNVIQEKMGTNLKV